jgi:hypothetical protein
VFSSSHPQLPTGLLEPEFSEFSEFSELELGGKTVVKRALGKRFL